MAEPVKQPININFSQGLDLKTDDKQVSVGKFLRLVNTVFDKVGRLTKRNGFPRLSQLPAGGDPVSYLTTFKGDLQAISNTLLSYSPPQASWIEKGPTYPLKLRTQSLIRNSLNQTQCDVAVSDSGLLCVVFGESDGATTTYKYAVTDAGTGQYIVNPTAIPVDSGAVQYGARVFLLGNYFLIVFGNSNTNLQYVAISTTTAQVVRGNTDIATSVANSQGLAFDGVVADSVLYLAWNGAAGGIKMVNLDSQLQQGAVTAVDASHQATLMSVCADTTGTDTIIWATYYDSNTSLGYALAVKLVAYSIVSVLAPTQVISTGTILNLATAAHDQTNTIFAEVQNAYSFDSGIPSNYVNKRTITEAGTTTPFTVSARSVGLASKAFLVDETPCYLAAYQSPYQPTYFLMNGDSSEATPRPMAKLAYQNGGGYLSRGLPNVVLSGADYYVPYLIKDLVQAVNKNTNVPPGSQTAGVYSQTGVNLAALTLTTDTSPSSNTQGLSSADIANNLHLSGGFLWMYDGFRPVEHGFFLYPDSVKCTWSATGGSIAAKPDGSTNASAYFVQVTYEWTDNQGNAFRSAPSIPVPITTTGSGTTGSIAVDVPTLRLTYKTVSSAKIVIYRWSVAQPAYYQATSISIPLQNSTTADSVQYVDTLADATILGNNLLYTTGGVLENIAAPASNILTLFDTRLWLLDAEDRNLFWYSKEVVESVPVEMSDLLTYYVSPTIGAQGSTGDVTAAAPMDDKLILFKENAIYYVNGVGPNSIGGNSQYSQPIYVTSPVGCTNPRSIVTIPDGLMFQSNKGIWLLGRNLGTQYIGAPVEDFNAYTVTSAVAVPGTNQVRFALSNGVTLMYDYHVGQWGEFEGIPSLSSTIFAGAHTIVNQYGQVSQETPNTYLDGTQPVLMSFKTSWLNLAGLRGYLRAYWFYFLGTYISPHKLQVEVAYDYNDSPSQGNLISPDNYAGPFGDDPYYGGDGAASFGSNSLENYRVFLERQRCKSFQISIQEVFDPTIGTGIAGQGLTMSGLNCVVGVKRPWAPINSNKAVG